MNDTSNLRDEGATRCVVCDNPLTFTIETLCPHGEALCERDWPGQCEPCCMVAAEEADALVGVETPC